MKFTQVRLPYGDTFLTADVPTSNIKYVLSAREEVGLPNEREAIVNALRSPTGSPGLAKCVKKNDKVVVIVTDNTRPCPDDRILPAVLSELESNLPRQNIKIIIGLGLHAPLNKDELTKKLGRDIVENYNVINHDPRKTRNIGVTSRGTPVEVFSEVLDADFRISTGFIEPHFFAGFSGARKSILPAVSSEKSIKTNHSFQMIEDPHTRAGILKGNPMHEDMVEASKMAKLNFIVNVLLNKDRGITHVVAGEPVKAHEKGCQLERGVVEVLIDHKVDITVTTNSGAPLDLDFYQTCKGIDTALQITREGGIIITASSCHKGVGPGEFRALHALSKSPQEVLTKVSCADTIGVCWQNHILARAQMKHNIYLKSSLDDSLVEQMMVTPIHSVEEGLDMAFAALGKNAEVAVIPDGPLVLPVLKEGRG
jgi:lactate racemase